MAEMKKSAIKKNARGMAMSRDALEKFKDLIQTIKSIDGIDFGDDEGFDVLLEFYMNSVEMYNEIATEDGEEYRFYASTKKSKKIDKSRIAKISTYDMDNLIEALNRIDGTPWTTYIDAEISEYGPPKDFYDIYDVVTTVQEKYDEGYYNNYSASAKKSKMKKYSAGDLIDIEDELLGIISDFINNNSGAIQIWYEDKSKYEKLRYCLDDALEYIRMDMPTKAKQSLMDYLNECDYNADAIKRVIGMIDAFDDVEGGAKSTKKSIPKSKDTTMSFTDNVNKMRVNNYAKTGNINTVMKKRD